MKKSLILTGWSKNVYLAAAAAALAALLDYDYPGNVRELINILDRARALEETDFKKLVAEHKRINMDLWAEGNAESGLPDNLDAAIRKHAKSVFDKFNQNLTAAKDALGISVNTLKKYLAEK